MAEEGVQYGWPCNSDGAVSLDHICRLHTDMSGWVRCYASLQESYPTPMDDGLKTLGYYAVRDGASCGSHDRRLLSKVCNTT